MVFTGTFEHTIDAKNRVAVPSDVRGLFAAGSSGSADGEPTYLYVTLGEGQALCLYTQQGFEQRAQELDNSQLDAEQLLEYERLMFSLARRVEMDKAGRVRLPEQLLKMVGLGSEVVLLGVKDHMEIRDRDTWNRHVMEMLQKNPNLLMNPRRAMKA